MVLTRLDAVITIKHKTRYILGFAQNLKQWRTDSVCVIFRLFHSLLIKKILFSIAYKRVVVCVVVNCVYNYGNLHSPPTTDHSDTRSVAPMQQQQRDFRHRTIECRTLRPHVMVNRGR